MTQIDEWTERQREKEREESGKQYFNSSLNEWKHGISFVQLIFNINMESNFFDQLFSLPSTERTFFSTYNECYVTAHSKFQTHHENIFECNRSGDWWKISKLTNFGSKHIIILIRLNSRNLLLREESELFTWTGIQLGHSVKFFEKYLHFELRSFFILIWITSEC